VYVCLCRAVTDGQIRAAVAAGATNLPALRSCLGVATDCRVCTRIACSVLKEAREVQMSKAPVDLLSATAREAGLPTT